MKRIATLAAAFREKMIAIEDVPSGITMSGNLRWTYGEYRKEFYDKVISAADGVSVANYCASSGLLECY